MRSFKEIFVKDVTYNNIKSHEKAWITFLTSLAFVGLMLSRIPVLDGASFARIDLL